MIKLKEGQKVYGTDGKQYLIERGDILKEGKSASITLDVASDSDKDFNNFLKLTKKSGIAYDIINMNSYGGWPEVKFYGDINKLRNWYVSIYGGYEDEFDEFID